MVMALYIPHDANTSSAMRHLYDTVSSQMSTYPENVHIVAGGFNHANLKSVVPKFHQHVKCATRGANTLNIVNIYYNIKLGYKAKQLPHLGESDHMSLLLILA